jgi:hypothetical protein
MRDTLAYAEGLRPLEREEKKLHTGTFSRYVHEREVWGCSLGANIGVEADGKHDNFERPVLVLMKNWT